MNKPWKLKMTLNNKPFVYDVMNLKMDQLIEQLLEWNEVEDGSRFNDDWQLHDIVTQHSDFSRDKANMYRN